MSSGMYWDWRAGLAATGSASLWTAESVWPESQLLCTHMLPSACMEELGLVCDFDMP